MITNNTRAVDICYSSGESAFVRIAWFFLSEEITFPAFSCTLIQWLFWLSTTYMGVDLPKFFICNWSPWDTDPSHSLLYLPLSFLLNSPLPWNWIFQKDVKGYILPHGRKIFLQPSFYPMLASLRGHWHGVFLTTQFPCLWALCWHGLLLHFVFILYLSKTFFHLFNLLIFPLHSDHL